MTATIGSLRDYDHGESWIRKRRIRRKRSNPTALTDTSSGLANDSLCRIVRLASSSVVNSANHSRNHALPNIGSDGQLAPDLYTHVVCFFATVGYLRHEQLAAVGHRGNEGYELQRRPFKTIGV